jgi:hypothetical protein
MPTHTYAVQLYGFALTTTLVAIALIALAM